MPRAGARKGIMIKKFLKKHRKIAEFLAKSLGYFWIDCPVCKEKFAGFEIGGNIWDREYKSMCAFGKTTITHGRSVCSKACEDHYIKTRTNFVRRIGDRHA